jgi:hypothetical protein
MRYCAVLAVICGVCFSSFAMGGPFDELSNRLEQFDEQDAPRQRKTRETLASYPETRTSQADAAPMEDGPGWEEPYGDYGGDCGGSCGIGCGDGWCNWAGCQCRQFWGRAEYLQWWVRGSNTPALVTTSPDGTPVGVAGVLPTATVLFGNERMNTDGRSGGRFTLGYWLDGCDTVGLENTFFFLGNAQQSYTNSSDGSPILARPFFNTQTNQQDAVLVAFPNIIVGQIGVTSSSQVYGNEINLRRALYVDCCRRVDVLAGYRFFQLAEDLRVATNTTSVDQEGPVPVGTTFNIFDRFHTRSQFNGGQLGVNAQFFRGCWSLDVLGKLALGGVTQTVTIDGATVVTVPNNAPVNNRGGILAQNSNIGRFQRTRFGVIPEFGVNLHRQLNPCWKLNVGYTLIVVTNVVRPGDQIDTQLDPNQFPPPATTGPFTAPAFAFHDSDVWLQGINVGLEYNY